MSRKIDPNKPFNEMTRDELRYLLDRGRIPFEKQAKVFAYLQEDRGEEPEPEAPQNPSEGAQGDESRDASTEPDGTDWSTYDPSERKVAEVISDLADADAETVQAVLDREREGKARSSLVSELESMLEEAAEEE